MDIQPGTLCKVLRLDQRDSDRNPVAFVRVNERPDYHADAPSEQVYCSTVTRWPSLIQQSGLLDTSKNKLIPLTGRNAWEREVLADLDRAEKRASERMQLMYDVEKARRA